MKIKEIRLEKGYTQKQLADMVKVSRQQINSWENGTRNPKLPAIKKLAEALECEISDLIKEG